MLNEKTGSKGLEFLLKPIVIGSIFGLSSILVLLVIMALFLSTGIFSLEVCSLFASICVAVGSFLGGIIAAKKAGKKGFASGGLTGLVLLILFSLLSLIAFKTTPTGATLVRSIIFLLGGVIGGILGVGSEGKRKIV